MAAPSVSDLKSFFAVKVSQFEPAPKSIVTISGQDNAKKVVQTLSTNEISSAIVEGKDGEHIGLVDFGDVVSFIVNSFYQHLDKHPTVAEEKIQALLEAPFIKDCSVDKKRKSSETRKSLDLNLFAELRQKFEAQPALSLSNLSKRNDFCTLPEDSTLEDVVKAFSSGIQRIAINSGGKVTHYVTQSSVVKYLAKFLLQMKPLTAQPISTLGFHPRKVHTIGENSIALEAFARMHEYGVSGLPLLDGSGHFTAAISIRDVRFALADFTRLLLPVRDYVIAVRNQSTFEANPTIFCKFSDPLNDVVRKLLAVKIHRLFVVDDTTHFTPIGVVSHQDILATLLTISRSS